MPGHYPEDRPHNPYTSKYSTLGIILAIIIESTTSAVAFLAWKTFNSFKKDFINRRIQLYMALFCCFSIFVLVATLAQKVFVNLEIDQNTGLMIFVTLVSGLVLTVNVVTTQLSQYYWYSTVVVLVNEVFIFLLIVCISECNSILEKLKIELKESRASKRDALRVIYEFNDNADNFLSRYTSMESCYNPDPQLAL